MVDYLAGYYAGRRSKAQDFLDFMGRYFPEQYVPYAKDIYDHLRTGIVHNLSLMNPWIPTSVPFILDKHSDFHLQVNDNKVMFSILHFIEDTRRSMVMFSYDLIMKPNENMSIVKNFQRRFNKQDSAASMMMKME